MRITRTLTSLSLVASTLLPSVALAAPLTVNQYERKTQFVDLYKRNKAWVEGRVKLVQTDLNTGELHQDAYEANLYAVREHVDSFDCYNKINLAACRTSAK